MEPNHAAIMERLVRNITRPDKALLTLYFIMSLAALVGFPFVFVPLYFRYHTLFYRFEDEGIAMGYGILFRREMHLTYARMQDIHLSQNLLERWLGIGTVTVQTAGAGEGGDLKIVGVRRFEEIRDFLYARMRGVRGEHGAQALPHASAAAETALLTEIRDELRAAAQALRSRGGAA